MGYDRFCKNHQQHVLIAGAASRVGHNEQCLDAARAVLRLTRRYSGDRVETAAGIALSRVHSPRYAHLRPILESRQDQHTPSAATSSLQAGGYVRGAAYDAGGAR